MLCCVFLKHQTSLLNLIALCLFRGFTAFFLGAQHESHRSSSESLSFSPRDHAVGSKQHPFAPGINDTIFISFSF